MDPERRLVEDRSEKLNRQVHPCHETEDDSKLSKMAFIEQEGHGFLMSTLRGRVAADEAFRRHVALGLETLGTWHVAIDDVYNNGLEVVDDGGRNGVPVDHASVDYNVLPGKNQRLRVARRLRDAAVERGPAYLPPR